MITLLLMLCYWLHRFRRLRWSISHRSFSSTSSCVAVSLNLKKFILQGDFLTIILALNHRDLLIEKSPQSTRVSSPPFLFQLRGQKSSQKCNLFNLLCPTDGKMGTSKLHTRCTSISPQIKLNLDS
jgi:hypothetical protein